MGSYGDIYPKIWVNGDNIDLFHPWKKPLLALH